MSPLLRDQRGILGTAAASIIVLLVALLLTCPAVSMAAPCCNSDKNVLVLYDSAGQYGYLGSLYVQHLTNLLSHFDINVTKKPVENYTAGDVKGYDVTFYLGVIYGNPLSDAFKSDVMTTKKPFCWIGYNLWQLDWSPPAKYTGPTFEKHFGAQFVGLDQSGWTTVVYKGKSLQKNALYPEINLTKVLDSSLATTVATCQNGTAAAVPYILHAGPLWFVADNPFAFVGTQDRYLAFADVLHDVLDSRKGEDHHAMIRIEDVSPKASPADLKAIADYLHQQNVPFEICVIPEYRDPLGVYNGGVPLTIKMTDAPDFLKALQYCHDRGGEMVMHGFTHQYDAVPNPYSGVTAEDYEFYRVMLDSNGNQVLMGPVPEDSTAWAQSRLLNGYMLMIASHFMPVAWNTPHYLASATDYQVIAQLTTTCLDQGCYFATDTTGIHYALQQMAPYVLNHDVYGIKRLPETIGYVDPTGTSGQVVLPADMLQRANANLVVRDGWASGYFHWYLDISYLKQLVTGLKGMGYKFTRASDY